MDILQLLAIPTLIVIVLAATIARRGGRMSGQNSSRANLGASHHALDRSDDTLRNDSWGF